MKGGKKGLIIVFTGDGKGKTTAALGCALRAAGYGMKTLMVEFIKEGGRSGEQKVCPHILKHIEIHAFGLGFAFVGDDIRPYMEIVEKGWIFMEEELKKGNYDLLILDELNVVLNLKLLPFEKVHNFLVEKDEKLHVIITGKDAPKELIKMADIVTEMREVKNLSKAYGAICGLDI
ncbi:MAG: cob(I)yrinic acid a,c-diamide adenosyltransferase [Desulfobacterota bacterium]|nr:cob(I)yrinic acid a,c-diamide adenosyltransferase [Thermodesulfobacteriota bacterium]MDW8002022.1 cob(I)yrinic acid a,c-diamide adenosyltransferase [Deltaproteobacteria bacterium]